MATGSSDRTCAKERREEEKEELFDDNHVVLEITEPMQPCANLCKLPYSNNTNKRRPRECIESCKQFLQFLDQAPRFCGWYAKVLQLQEGPIYKDSTWVVHDNLVDKFLLMDTFFKPL